MWFDEIFESDDFFPLYSFKEKHKQVETFGLIEMMNLQKEDTLLDLCCGYGRISFELKNRLNVNLYGLDRSKKLLNMTKRRKYTGNNPPIFLRGDMSSLPLKSKVFDGIFNIYTSFGYFEEEKQNLAVLKECHRILKKKGKLLIDLINKDWVLQNMRERDWVSKDNLFILEETKYDKKKNQWNTKKIFIDGEEIREYVHLIKAYNFKQLNNLLENAGFKVIKVFGHWDLQEFNKDSVRMITLAEKL